RLHVKKNWRRFRSRWRGTVGRRLSQSVTWVGHHASAGYRSPTSAVGSASSTDTEEMRQHKPEQQPKAIPPGDSGWARLRELDGFHSQVSLDPRAPPERKPDRTRSENAVQDSS